MFADTTPNLKLIRTVSNPVCAAKVIGYQGRNTFLGIDALIITADAEDVGIEDRNGRYFLVPTDEGQAVVSGDRHLYVLNDGVVYGYTPDDYVDDKVEIHVEGETFHAVNAPKATARWDRETVEVTN